MLSIIVTVIQWWELLLIILGTIIATAIVTFIVSRNLFKKSLKKNPPISEAAIRVMFQQMGRTPSEKQVKAVMRSMYEANDK